MIRSGTHNPFELESLEERILLSADSLLGGLAGAAPDNLDPLFDMDLRLPPLEEVPLLENTHLQESTPYDSEPYDPCQKLDDIFSGLLEEDLACDEDGDSEGSPYETSVPSEIQEEQNSLGLEELGEESSQGSILPPNETLDSRLCKPVFDYFSDGTDPPSTEGELYPPQDNQAAFGDLEKTYGSLEGRGAPCENEIRSDLEKTGTDDGDVCLDAGDGIEPIFIFDAKAASDGPNDLILRLRDEEPSIVELLDNTQGAVLNSISLAGLDKIEIWGADDGDDTLTVDLSAPLPLALDIVFHGGDGGFDSLVLIGNECLEVNYTAIGTDSGLAELSSEFATVTIFFTGLEPVTVSEVEEYTFRTDGGTDAIIIDSPAEGRNRITGTSDGTTFESVTFFDVGSVTIDTAANDQPGNDSDSITIDSSGLVASGLLNFTLPTTSALSSPS